MEVELVHWPAGEQRRSRLGARGRPRLLLVARDTPAPVTLDPLEDWIWLPVDRAELSRRVATLAQRAGTAPTIDDEGVLRWGSGWVALPPVEVRIMGALLDGFGKVVGRGELLAAGWPGTEPRRNVLDVHLVRLRRRLEPLGLAIVTVRKRGYVLGPAASPASPAGC